MFAVPRAGRSLQYAYVPDCWSDVKFRRHVNVPFQLSLAFLSHTIVFETELTEAVWQIATCELSTMGLATVFPCARDGLCVRWTSDSRIGARGAQGVLSPLPSRVLRVVNDKTFLRLDDGFSFDMGRDLL